MPIYPEHDKQKVETPLVLIILLFLVTSAGLLFFLSSDHDNPVRREADKERISQYLTEVAPLETRSIPSPMIAPKVESEAKVEEPSKVRVILKVFPEETKFKLSMVKPEELDLGEPESNIVELMMNAGMNYILKLESPEGVRRFVQLKPGGEAEYHYVNF